MKGSESHYPAHKLEFLALKWAVTEKFHDYLYGNFFEVWTDNNPLTYLLSSARLDATGHRWLAQLTNYNFKIYYKSGVNNKDADALSRLPEIKNIDISAVHALQEANNPFDGYAYSLVIKESPEPHASEIAPVINVSVDQVNDPDLQKIITWKKADQKPSYRSLKDSSQVIRKLWHEWTRLFLENDTLYRKICQHGQDRKQIIVPALHYRKVFDSLHTALGHPGRDKTIQLISSRFYWPGLSTYVEKCISTCERCVCHKSKGQKVPMIPIITTQPLELVCMDYLLVEPSYGYEHLLVITDHFTKFACVVATKNESAKTTAKALLDHFINIYGYPKRLHSDQGRNFQSKVIEHLCNLTGIEKSRTTPYHPMGNGACERFNQTLLKMLGTLENDKKSKWKDYLGSIVHAYNCLPHETTGYSPYELMFGRSPRLPVDEEFGLIPQGDTEESYSEYINKLHERLEYTHNLAKGSMQKAAEKISNIIQRNAVLDKGDLVLVRKTGLVGRNKLADRWETETYVVLEQPNCEVPVYKVSPHKGKGRTRTLHRNMLLPVGELVSSSINPNNRVSADKHDNKSKQEQRSVPSVQHTELQIDSDSEEEIIYEQQWHPSETCVPPPDPIDIVASLPPVPGPDTDNIQSILPDSRSDTSVIESPDVHAASPSVSSSNVGSPDPAPTQITTVSPDKTADPPSPTLRRSGRNRRAPERFQVSQFLQSLLS